METSPWWRRRRTTNQTSENRATRLIGNSSVYGIGKILWWKISMHMMKYQHTCAGTPAQVCMCIYETMVSTNLWINPEAGPIQPNPEAMVFSSTLWAGGVNLATKKLTRTWDLTTYVPGPRSKAPDFETKIPRHLVLTTSGYLPTARFLVPCPRYLLPAAEGFAGRDLAGRLVSVEHQVGTEHAQIQLDQGSRI